MTPLLGFLLLVVVAYAVVTVGMVRVNETDPPPAKPCLGDCVPRRLYLHERRKKLQWRRYSHRVESQRNRLLVRWRPTVWYAIRLASAVYDVPRSQMTSVAWCESRFDPFAQNGRYKGIFQLGWSPFGFSPYDPFANALSAAATVRHDGSWRQWECKP